MHPSDRRIFIKRTLSYRRATRFDRNRSSLNSVSSINRRMRLRSTRNDGAVPVAVINPWILQAIQQELTAQQHPPLSPMDFSAPRSEDRSINRVNGAATRQRLRTRQQAETGPTESMRGQEAVGSHQEILDIIREQQSDELASFFRNICCTVRRFQPRNIIRMKEQIFSAVISLEREELENQQRRREEDDSDLEDDVFL